MYKFADGSGGCYAGAAGWTAATCTPEASHNSALGFDLGGEYRNFFADVVYQKVNQAISVVNPLLGPQSPTQPYQSTTNSINQNPITGANLIGTDNTEYGIVTDNTALMAAIKYVWEPLRLYAGYEHIRYDNPSSPLGIGATAQGGYRLSGVEDNNLDSPRITQVWWTGVRFAFDEKTGFTLSYYHQQQNDYRVPPTCTPASFRSSCAGTLEETSLYIDHHFTKRFDVYGGVAYSDVSGGLAVAIPHGPGVRYNYNNNFAPVIGGRFAF
jgi:predicted porin